MVKSLSVSPYLRTTKATQAGSLVVYSSLDYVNKRECIFYLILLVKSHPSGIYIFDADMCNKTTCNRDMNCIRYEYATKNYILFHYFFCSPVLDMVLRDIQRDPRKAVAA